MRKCRNGWLPIAIYLLITAEDWARKFKLHRWPVEGQHRLKMIFHRWAPILHRCPVENLHITIIFRLCLENKFFCYGACWTRNFLLIL
jgi:hypothetical protein